ncbi:hypothetical protein EWM64_g3862 [Hericium alpestre]|uniref:SGNH hydrolase-type esterase domain-containing protein n=1 Tax=Hericium alpestre TaxID=135208 RepID=A0A4Z0A1U7_9AGAM|nr:hypothetical protein EWM64_g3862 [Hericium alpestre]
MRLAAAFATVASLLLASYSWAAPAAPSLGPRPGQIKNFVTFGDSYTDVTVVSNNGTQWPVYAAGYAHLNLFPFAHSGAPCSQLLTPRPFPAVVQNELPEYFAAVGNRSIRVNPEETIYTLWIGTNDLGPNTLLTGGVVNNATIVDVTKCTVGWINTLYKSGARNFLYQNRLPLYAVDSYPNRFWTAERNTTAWNLFINELAVSGNEIAKLMLQTLPASLPGAHIGLFDSHSLFNDILDNPSQYLNGTAPLNITGAVHACRFKTDESTSDPGECTDAEGTDRDSFAWYDELHPSEQSDRVVAREIANVISVSPEMRSMNLLTFIRSVLAISPRTRAAAHGPKPGQIKNLVTFGDSYTDVAKPRNNGTQWPVYAAGYAHANLFPFAHSGAACSDLLTPTPFPSVMQNELPEYFAATGNGSIKVKPDETIYTLWIGTNDLGPHTLLNDEVLHNATIVDVTKCAIGWIKTLYKSGARNFLYQNIIPLQRVPLYSVDGYWNHYWNQPRNRTE